jgi:short-subunit dehydrogenase
MDNKNRYILILGANSDIAKAIAKKYAQKGYNIYLAGRDIENLKLSAKDLEIRFSINSKALFLDILDFNSHNSFYNSLDIKPYGTVMTIGYLGDQKVAEKNNDEAKKIIDTNFTGVVNLLNIIANDYEERKNGFIIGISSVAGDRGRASNYLYGSAKAGFTAYLSGLRNRLSKKDVNVLTVKPGFVQTAMTENLSLPPLLTAQPDEVANDIIKAQEKNKNIIYTKWFWRIIMCIINRIPERIFKKLSL